MIGDISTENATPIQWIRHPISILLGAMSIVVLFYRFTFGNGFIAYYHDDFFYYVKIASNVVAHKGVTFDGIHRTNGFHPLYLLFLILLKYLAPDKSFFILLQLVIFAAVMATYLYAVTIIFRFTTLNSLGRLAACCVAYFALVIMRGGMEVILTIPLTCSLIYFLLQHRTRWQPEQFFSCALLMSAVILSRLDTSLLVLLLLICIWLRKRAVLTLSKLLSFAAGLLPVIIYALVNIRWFHTIMPVSGQAKQLRTSHFPSTLPFESIVLGPFSPTRTPFAVGSCLALLVGVICLWRRRNEIEGWSAVVLLTLLIFPLFHLAFYSVMSDWQFFPWYLYPFVLSSIAASAVILPTLGPEKAKYVFRFATPFIWAVEIALIVFSVLLVRSQRPDDRDVYANAMDIRDFAEHHPGVYAMGDRAGYVGYLIQQPVIQLEGLVEDEQYLQKLKAREPLRSILNDYEVAYYVGANPVKEDGCYRMTEPLQGGPTVYRVQGVFCEAPVATFRHGGYETVIFATTPR
jgi:hypothetical protein